MMWGIILVLAQSMIVAMVSGGKSPANTVRYDNAIAQGLIDGEINRYKQNVMNGLPTTNIRDLPDHVSLDSYCREKTISHKIYKFCMRSPMVMGFDKPIVQELSKTDNTGRERGQRRSVFKFRVQYPKLSLKFSWAVTRGLARPATKRNSCEGNYRTDFENTEARGQIRMRTNDKGIAEEIIDVDLKIHTPITSPKRGERTSVGHCDAGVADFVLEQTQNFEQKYLYDFNATVLPMAKTKLQMISKKLLDLHINSALNQDSE